MAYCTECGTECANCAGQREERAELDRAIEIARLETKRDIEVARISAGQWKDETETTADADIKIAEIEAEAGVEAAEAVAEVLEEIVTPEPEPEPEPIIVNDVVDDAEPEPTIEPAESAPPPKENKGLWW